MADDRTSYDSAMLLATWESRFAKLVQWIKVKENKAKVDALVETMERMQSVKEDSGPHASE
jgi:hypothetical protein